MRRIYFLVPDIAITHKIVDELRSEGIEDRHIHILAKRDTPLEDIPEAGVTLKTDFIPALERGAALGGSNYWFPNGGAGGDEFRQFKIKKV